MTVASLETADELKARGAFYTPTELTRFLASWAVRAAEDRVLEPSCGDGAFVTALVERFAALGRSSLDEHLIGTEREAHESSKAKAIAPSADIRTLNFFDLELETTGVMDVVIGNPPYIRYHGFTGADRDLARARAREQGVELTQLASSWAHFVAHAAGFLKASGRLAMVLPAELLHTDYAHPVRELLVRRFSSVIVVAFDRLVFPDAQVDAILLLASNDDAFGLRIVRLPDEHSLAGLDLRNFRRGLNGASPGRWSAAVDSDAGAVYEDATAASGGRRLGDVASVDIGFVSGANDFFVLSDEDVDRRGLPRRLLTPAIRRPSDVRGIYVRPGETRWLLDLSARADLEATVLNYIAHGEAIGVSQHYKCRVRTPWYAVPLPRRRPDAFMPYMFHLGPRLIVNERGAWSTNLLHGVALRDHAPAARALSVAMASSLTLLSAEIEGRAYGGGVLKLETREAERLIVPSVVGRASERLAAMFDAADSLIRQGDVQALARLVDEILGLDHERLWSAYLKFRERRLGRKRLSAISRVPPVGQMRRPITQ